MDSGDLRANYYSATRKVSHIQNSGHGPVVSSSSADIVVLIRVIFEYARPDGRFHELNKRRERKTSVFLLWE